MTGGVSTAAACNGTVEVLRVLLREGLLDVRGHGDDRREFRTEGVCAEQCRGACGSPKRAKTRGWRRRSSAAAYDQARAARLCRSARKRDGPAGVVVSGHTESEATPGAGWDAGLIGCWKGAMLGRRAVSCRRRSRVPSVALRRRLALRVLPGVAGALIGAGEFHGAWGLEGASFPSLPAPAQDRLFIGYGRQEENPKDIVWLHVS